MTGSSIHESHALGPVYVVCAKFDPSVGYEWERYVEWAGLRHLSEVVTLDSMLCERSPEDFIDEDWPYVVNENFMLDYVLDLDYLLKRAGPLENKSLLCAFRNPPRPPEVPPSPYKFSLLGYDVVDVTSQISATLNCGGFPDVFSASDLNAYGLVGSLQVAQEIQRALLQKYESRENTEHTQTNVWAIFRAAL